MTCERECLRFCHFVLSKLNNQSCKTVCNAQMHAKRVLLVHGTADKIVPYCNAVALHDAMQQIGTPAA